MKKDTEKMVTLPEGYTAQLNEHTLTIKGNGKEVSRHFPLNRVKIDIKGNELKVYAKNATKRQLTTIGTTVAHINNLIKGLENDFEYVLEVCNVHFPMNVKVEGNNVIIKSFLGEKAPRSAKIVSDVKVDIKGSTVTVTSPYIEKAGQTAANIEKASRLVGRDRRIFQDGIFLTSKNGRAI